MSDPEAAAFREAAIVASDTQAPRASALRVRAVLFVVPLLVAGIAATVLLRGGTNHNAAIVGLPSPTPFATRVAPTYHPLPSTTLPKPTPIPATSAFAFEDPVLGYAVNAGTDGVFPVVGVESIGEVDGLAAIVRLAPCSNPIFDIPASCNQVNVRVAPLAGPGVLIPMPDGSEARVAGSTLKEVVAAWRTLRPGGGSAVPTKLDGWPALAVSSGQTSFDSCSPTHIDCILSAVIAIHDDRIWIVDSEVQHSLLGITVVPPQVVAAVAAHVHLIGAATPLQGFDTTYSAVGLRPALRATIPRTWTRPRESVATLTFVIRTTAYCPGESGSALGFCQALASVGQGATRAESLTISISPDDLDLAAGNLTDDRRFRLSTTSHGDRVALMLARPGFRADPIALVEHRGRVWQIAVHDETDGLPELDLVEFLAGFRPGA